MLQRNDEKLRACCSAASVTVGRVNTALQQQLRCVSIAWVWVLLCIGGWAAPTKRCSRPPVRSPGARHSMAQPGERAVRRHSMAQPGERAVRRHSTAAHKVSVASAQHSVELPVRPVTTFALYADRATIGTVTISSRSSQERHHENRIQF